MNILEYIILYLFIGVCLNLFYETLTKYMDKKGKLKDYLNDEDKLIAIIIWPLGFLIFLQSFLKAFFYGNDK